MKKITSITSVLLVVILFSISTPSITFSQTFRSEAEIDAYYDAQLQQLQAETDIKNKAVTDKLNADLEKIHKDGEAEIWAMLKEVYGADFEMVKPFLVESKPDPEQIVNKYLYPSIPRAVGLNFIKNITAINPDLGKKVLEIYNARPTTEPVITPTPSQKIPSSYEMFNYIDSIENPYEAVTDFQNIKTKNPTMYKEVLKMAETKYFSGKLDPENMFTYMDSLPEKEASKMSNKMMIYNPTLQLVVNEMGKIKYPDGKFNDDGTVKTPASKSSIIPTTVQSSKPSPMAEKNVVTVPTLNITAPPVQATPEIKQDVMASSTSLKVTDVKPEKKSFIQKAFGFLSKLMFWR